MSDSAAPVLEIAQQPPPPATQVKFLVEGEWVRAHDVIGYVIGNVWVKDRTVVVVARKP